MIYKQPETRVVIYLNYPKGVPFVETTCTLRAIDMADKCYVIAPRYDWLKDTNAIILPVAPFENYVRDKIGINELKAIHYADFLAYYSIEVLRDVYDIHLDNCLKIDADYYITSKYQLRNLFNNTQSGVAVDSGYNLKYGKIPQIFRNVHVVYRCSDSRIGVGYVSFADAVRDYYNNNHYTATGPSLLNKDDYPEIPGFIPFTSDPCLWTGEGDIIVEIPHGALGYHIQSSLAHDLGLSIEYLNLDMDLLTIGLEEDIK